MISIPKTHPFRVDCFEGHATVKVKTLLLFALASFIGSLAAAFLMNL